MAIEVITIQPGPAEGQDAHIRSNIPDRNDGTGNDLNIGDGTLTGQSFRTLAKYHLPTVPPEKVLHAASWKATKISGDTSPLDVSVHAITEDWSHTTVTWATQPAFSGTAAASGTISGANGTVSTITGLGPLVQAWLDGTTVNRGILLKKAIENPGSGGSKSLASSRHATASYRPILELTLRLAATAAPTSPVGTSASPANAIGNTPRLNWNYSSPDGGAQQRYQVRIFDSHNSLVHTSAEVTSANKYYDVPAEAALEFGAVYRWQVRVHDGIWGPWSDDEAYFRCILSPPTGLIAEAVPSQAAIGLTWVGSPYAAGYHVYQRRPGMDQWTRITPALVTETELLIDAVGFGVAYEFAVVSASAFGVESEMSEPVVGLASWTTGEWWLGGLNLGPDVSDWQPDLPWHSSVVPLIGYEYPGYQSQGPGAERIGVAIICDGEEAYQSLKAELKRPEPLALRDPYGRVRRVRPDPAGIRSTQMVAQNRVLYRVTVRLVEVAPSA